MSETITARDWVHPNFVLILSDGSNVAVPPSTVHVAYSNQLIEHLHPDDAFVRSTAEHLSRARSGRNVFVHQWDIGIASSVGLV